MSVALCVPTTSPESEPVKLEMAGIHDESRTPDAFPNGSLLSAPVGLVGRLVYGTVPVSAAMVPVPPGKLTFEATRVSESRESVAETTVEAVAEPEAATGRFPYGNVPESTAMVPVPPGKLTFEAVRVSESRTSVATTTCVALESEVPVSSWTSPGVLVVA
jgi:hypothetical protein